MAIGAVVGVEARGNCQGAAAHGAPQCLRQHNQRPTRGMDGRRVEIGVRLPD